MEVVGSIVYLLGVPPFKVFQFFSDFFFCRCVYVSMNICHVEGGAFESQNGTPDSLELEFADNCDWFDIDPGN